LTEITTSAALEAMSKPDANGQVHVKRTGPKGLLPSTWLSRALRLEYVVCGQLRETTGTLLDVYPAGPILNAGGMREPGGCARCCVTPPPLPRLCNGA
jgi:hypothetical protein